MAQTCSSRIVLSDLGNADIKLKYSPQSRPPKGCQAVHHNTPSPVDGLSFCPPSSSSAAPWSCHYEILLHLSMRFASTLVVLQKSHCAGKSYFNGHLPWQMCRAVWSSRCPCRQGPTGINCLQSSRGCLRIVLRPISRSRQGHSLSCRIELPCKECPCQSCCTGCCLCAGWLEPVGM